MYETAWQEPGDDHTRPHLVELAPQDDPEGVAASRTSGRVRIYGLDYWPDVTGIAPYTTAFAEYLAAQGDVVDVVAGMPYYPEWQVKPGYERTFRRTEERNGVTIHRRRQYIPTRQSAARRALYEATFVAQNAFDTLPRPDLVIGVMPALSDGVLAVRAARKHNVPMTLWIQDLFGQAALQSGVDGGRSVSANVARLEGWIARQADALAIIAEGFRAPLESLGVDPDRIHRVRNWTHISPPTMTQHDARIALDLPLDRTIVMHAGNMGLKQGLENLVEAARLAVDTAPELLFVLMGHGSQRPRLETLAKGLPNLRFLDPVSNEMFPNALYAADILLINQLGSVIDMSLPSKLTSYLAVGRPVVAAVHPESETARAVEESGAGSVVSPGSPEEILRVMRDVSIDRRIWSLLGESGQEYADVVLSAEETQDRLRRTLLIDCRRPGVGSHG
jgi:colanic acid biosynthesis glycosyl transferase WcaI